MSPARPPRLNGLAPVGFAALATIVSLARIPLRRWDALLFEDGSLFIQNWLEKPSIFLFVAPFAGYIHLIPRIAGGLIVLLPVSWWGVAATVVSCLVVGGISTGVWLATKAMGMSRFASVTLAAVPVISPITSYQQLGSLCNLHYYCTYLLFWVAVAGNRLKHSWTWAAVITLALLTEIQGILLVPIVAWIWWRKRVAWPIVGAWVFGATAQLITTLTAPSSVPPRPEGAPTSLEVFYGYINTVVLHGFGSQQLEGIGDFSPRRLIAGCLMLAVSLAFCFIALRRSPYRWHALLLIVLSVVCWTVSVVVNNAGFGVLRWGTTAAMLLVAAVVLALGETPPRPQLVVGIILAALLLRGFYGYQLLFYGDGLPRWSQAVTAAKGKCVADGSDVELREWDWTVEVPCSIIRRW